MEGSELFQHLLGISDPWTVKHVNLDMTRGQEDVFVGHAKGAKVLCSECGHILAVYDYSV